MAFIEENMIMICSLSVTAIFAVFSLGAGHILLGKSQPIVEKWILVWIVFDVLIHFLLEGPFVFLSLTGTVNSSNHFSALLWKEYGKADSRWLYSDPTVVSLEFVTVTLCAILCLVLIYSIVTKAYYRHFVQIVVCVCELYGGWMTFCPEWLTGSPSLDTNNFMYLWVYLFFFNFLWVIIPLALLYHSWEAMRKAFGTHRQSGMNKPSGTNKQSDTNRHSGTQRQSGSGQNKSQGKMKNQSSGDRKNK